MKEDWKECKLGEIVEIHRGASPRPIQKFIATSGMPWVKISDATANNSRFIDSTKEFIIEEGISKSVIVNPEDLIVSNSATPGLPKIMKIKACIHDGWLYFENYKNITRDFLYYKFFDIQKRLTNLANGSVFQNLKTDIVRNFIINLPPLATQQKIATILSSLDDKIELNNKINTNLEQQAQALFEDFFPNVIDDDGLNKMEELITFSNGKKRPEESGIIPVFGGNGILAYTNKSNNENCCIIGRVGAYCGNIFLSQNKCWISDNAISAKSKDTDSQFFIFYLLKKANLQTRHIGSGQPLLTQGILNSISINIPQKQTIEQFNDLLKPIFDQIFNNSRQNENLVSIRDTLLPKLMNGEFEVLK